MSFWKLVDVNGFFFLLLVAYFFWLIWVYNNKKFVKKREMWIDCIFTTTSSRLKITSSIGYEAIGWCLFEKLIWKWNDNIHIFIVYMCVCVNVLVFLTNFFFLFFYSGWYFCRQQPHITCASYFCIQCLNTFKAIIIIYIYIFFFFFLRRFGSTILYHSFFFIKFSSGCTWFLFFIVCALHSFE